jgi:hypothetical protein
VRWAAAGAAAVAVVGFGSRFGFLRAALAVAMFTAIMFVGVRYLRTVVTVLPEPEVTEVGDLGLKYVCSMCGLELRVEKAARDKAPSHCMEPMVLVREGGRPPLRPV